MVTIPPEVLKKLGRESELTKEEKIRQKFNMDGEDTEITLDDPDPEPSYKLYKMKRKK
jgi:hypothetical protein